MFLFKSLIESPIPDAARQGHVRVLSPAKHRPRPLLLERLENRLCLSMWSEPVDLGSVINTSSYQEIGAALSPDGLSLYFSSTRPGGFAPPGDFNIWFSQRASLADPWGPPQNLGSAINSSGSYSYDPSFSPDGHRLFFITNRPGGYGGDDIWVSSRDDAYDDFGWQPPVNLGPGVNSPDAEFGPSSFEDANTGITTLYFSSDRPNSVSQDPHIYASTLQEDGTFAAAVLVPELSSPYLDSRAPTIRSDGLEIFFPSKRPGGLGSGRNIWVSTRASTLDSWSTPVNLGAPINNAGFETFSPVLSPDGNTMFFDFGSSDLYMSTRLPFVADHFTLSAPAGTTAGQTFSMILTAWDHYGNIATGYTGTVTFTSSDPHATLPVDYTFTAADNGTHTFDATLVKAGAQLIKITDTAGEVIGAQASMAVNPAAADHFQITAPSVTISGTPFDVTLTALDPYGNVDTNYTGTTSWSCSDTDPGVILPADYTFQTSDNGTHTFTATLLTSGDQTLTATDTVSGMTGSATITVGPGPQAPPGGGARRPRIPRLNADSIPASEPGSVDHLFASFREKSGLLFPRRGHDKAADDLLGTAGAGVV